MTEIYFSHSRRLGISTSRCWQIWCVVRTQVSKIVTFSVFSRGRRDELALGVSFIRTLIPIMRALHGPPSTGSTSQYHPLGIRIPSVEGHKHSACCRKFVIYNRIYVWFFIASGATFNLITPEFLLFFLTMTSQFSFQPLSFFYVIFHLLLYVWLFFTSTETIRQFYQSQ